MALQLQVHAREVELLRSAMTEALRWLDVHAPGRAHEALTRGLKIKS